MFGKFVLSYIYIYIKTQENILIILAKYEKCGNTLFYVGIYTA